MILFNVEDQFAVALALESSIIIHVNIPILRSNHHKLLSNFCVWVKLEELRCAHTISCLNEVLLADYRLLRLCILRNFNYFHFAVHELRAIHRVRTEHKDTLGTALLVIL